MLIPYIKRKREELNIPNKPWLLICDVFKDQWTEAVKNVVKESNGKMVSVPNNWTNYFQPLDLIINVSMLKLLHAKWTVKYYDYARTKQQLIISGWKESGIIDHLVKKIDLDLFSSLG